MMFNGVGHFVAVETFCRLPVGTYMKNIVFCLYVGLFFLSGQPAVFASRDAVECLLKAHEKSGLNPRFIYSGSATFEIVVEAVASEELQEAIGQLVEKEKKNFGHDSLGRSWESKTTEKGKDDLKQSRETVRILMEGNNFFDSPAGRSCKRLMESWGGFFDPEKHTAGSRLLAMGSYNQVENCIGFDWRPNLLKRTRGEDVRCSPEFQKFGRICVMPASGSGAIIRQKQDKNDFSFPDDIVEDFIDELKKRFGMRDGR